MHELDETGTMAADKQQLTITIDPHLVEAGQRAVNAGQASSMSSWISAAIEEKIVRDQKLTNLSAAIAYFEAEHGEIKADEIATQRRADRTHATVVRGQLRSQLLSSIDDDVWSQSTAGFGDDDLASQ